MSKGIDGGAVREAEDRRAKLGLSATSSRLKSLSGV